MVRPIENKCPSIRKYGLLANVDYATSLTQFWYVGRLFINATHQASKYSLMTLKHQLKNLHPTALIAIIESVYGRYDDIDELIDCHLDTFSDLLRADANPSRLIADNKLARLLKRQLDLVVAEDQFIDYRASHAYAARLERLLLDIEALAEDSPAQALPLVEDMLNRHGAIIEGVDDSGGGVGDVLAQAASIWLDIAAGLRNNGDESRNWVEAVVALYEKNDYGCLDDLISQSAELLSEGELRQLAQRFEKDAQKALADKRITGYNSKTTHACLGIQSVAIALSDMELFEKPR